MTRIIQSIFHRLGLEIHRLPKTPQKLEEIYFKTGRIPFSLGYEEAKARFLQTVLSNELLLDLFKKSEPLPMSFGIGFDERCVEYPWVFSRLRKVPEKLLDAGSTLNYDYLINHPLIAPKKVHILNLTAESQCFWRNNISYVFDDIREMPYRDQNFDTIICISTLEHVGLDNQIFTRSEKHTESNPDTLRIALLELRRVLKPGGTLMVTVPYGKSENRKTQQVFDQKMIREMLATFSPSSSDETYFLYSNSGWQIASAEECKNAEYVDWIMLPADVRPSVFPKSHDNAAAARAVACLTLSV